MSNQNSAQDGFDDIITTMNSGSFLLMFSLGFMGIVLMQSVWETISGLYFSYAYEAVIWPLTIFVVFNLSCRGNGRKTNQTREVFVLLSFTLLFAPALYLLLTQQLDLHGAVYSTYDPELTHMPYAELLPYIFLLAMFTPYKDFLTRE